MDEDYVGKLKLMELLGSLYGLEIDTADIARAQEQLDTIEEAMEQNPDLAASIPHFEARYQAQLEHPEVDIPPLPLEVERFLQELGGEGAD